MCDRLAQRMVKACAPDSGAILSSSGGAADSQEFSVTRGAPHQSPIARPPSYYLIVSELVGVTLRGDGDVQKTRAKLHASAPRQPVAVFGHAIEMADFLIDSLGEPACQCVGMLVGRRRSLGHAALTIH